MLVGGVVVVVVVVVVVGRRRVDGSHRVDQRREERSREGGHRLGRRAGPGAVVTGFGGRHVEATVGTLQTDEEPECGLRPVDGAGRGRATGDGGQGGRLRGLGGGGLRGRTVAT